MSDGVVQADSDDLESASPGLGKERHPVANLGDFPFPILDRGRESRQIVWLRNHANYMAAGGVLDYVRAVSVVIRGLVVNLLVAMPYLLLMGLGVAALNVSGWRFGALILFLVLAVVWVATAPIATRLWNAARLNKIDALGTTSSVAIRDRFERSFGALLLLIALAATIEGMSFFLDDFHRWTRESSGSAGLLSSLGTLVLIVGAGAGPLLPKLGKVAKPLALVVVGLVGLLVPVLIVMFVADFLVFSRVTDLWLERILLAGLTVVAFMVIGFVVILLSDRRSVRSLVTAGLMLLLAAGLFAVLWFGADRFWSEDARTSFTDLVALDVSGSEGLMAATSASPPPELITLQNLIDAHQTYLAEEAARDQFVSPDDHPKFDASAPHGARLADALSALTKDVSYFPGIATLVDEVHEDFATGWLDVEQHGGAIAEELEQLRWRVLELEPVLTSGQSMQDFVIAVMDVDLERPQDLVAVGEELVAEGRDLQAQGFQEDGQEMVAWGQSLIAEARNVVENSPLGVWDDDLYYVNLFYGIDDPQNAFLIWYLPEQFPNLSEAFFATDLVFSDLADVEFQLVLAREQILREAVFSSRAATIADSGIVSRVRWASFRPAAIASLILAALVWLYSWLAVDPNRTSLNGMYRDRLAAAFLVGADTKGDVDVEVDLDLRELSRHDAGSIAPYHLLNAVVNLQGSKEISIQDRSGDFFMFSKRFVGSKLTGYCRSETMEHVFPEMSLSTAMAVSGAAASPNMGRSTKPALVAFMTLLNIRLGLWVPNPGRLEDKIGLEPRPAGSESRPVSRRRRWFARGRRGQPGGFTIEEVIEKEDREIRNRWRLLPNAAKRIEENELVGLAYSGGGIRSATLNLGITQALHRAGVFQHVDYMSSVSGGGYLASSISSAMRSRCPTRTDRAGVATLVRHPDGKQVLSLRYTNRASTGDEANEVVESHVYESYAELDQRIVDNQGKVKKGQRLLMLADPEVMAHEKSESEAPKRRRRVSFGDMFGWRVRPTALLREIGGSLNEDSRSVNISDGGHIENLATIELLRRRCKFIVVGDAEMDAKHHFKGLMVLLRTARVEEGIDIQINLDALRLGSGGHSHDERDHAMPEGGSRRTERNWAIGKIIYPDQEECGYLLYLKSSLTGNEDETILGYHAQYPEFPHQSTADQFFDEGQFESYRTLGYHIASDALRRSKEMHEHLEGETDASFSDLQRWFKSLWRDFGADQDSHVDAEETSYV